MRACAALVAQPRDIFVLLVIDTTPLHAAAREADCFLFLFYSCICMRILACFIQQAIKV